jgi:hypothetical protein
MRGTARLAAALTLALTVVCAGGVRAAEEEVELGWFNRTELAAVFTDGNADSQTFGFKHKTTRQWERSRGWIRLEGTQAEARTASRFAVGSPMDFDIIEPDREKTVENYLAELRYDHRISERTFWNAGVSWDRNLQAGIEDRYIGYAGVGNIWWDRADLKFNTSYGVSYTDRTEEQPDPDKEDSFAGVRFNWGYLNKFGKVTTYTNDWTVNVSLDDTEDWNFDMVNAISVAMSERLALKVSLQWLYNNLPALETIVLLDPVMMEIGTVEVRKDELDTILSASLVIDF